MDLNEKIENSIKIIRKMEKVALQYSPDGFHVAFSGGKDSQVIYELCKMAGVKFKAYFYKTSVDPPELLRFIRSEYPNVIWLKPGKTMFQLILKKKMLPLRNRRYCCEYLKERRGLNELVIIGIRKEESARRAKRKVFTNDCKLGCDKPLLSPILDWTESDVFKFLRDRNIQVCELYDKMNRIGCIGCPMNCKSQRDELRMFPMFRKAYINTIEKLRVLYGKYMEFESAEDALNWWCSGISKKKYLTNKKQLKFPWWDEMIMKTLILLLAFFTLPGCKTTYNYIVITPAKEVKKPDIKPNPVLDRWNYVDMKRLERVSDSISNILNNHDTR